MTTPTKPNSDSTNGDSSEDDTRRANDTTTRPRGWPRCRTRQPNARETKAAAIWKAQPRPHEGIRELETPAVIDAINTGGKYRSTCPRQPLGILEFAVTDGSKHGLNEALGWNSLATYH